MKSTRWTLIVAHSAGELNSDELERLVTIIQNPTQFKIPTWFLNRQRDIVDGKNSQILSNGVDSKLRDDLERLKKIRAHRGLRHFWGLRVRGQHTKTTGMSYRSLCPQSRLTPLNRPSWQDCRCLEEAWLNLSFFSSSSLCLYCTLSVHDLVSLCYLSPGCHRRLEMCVVLTRSADYVRGLRFLCLPVNEPS